MTLKPGTRCECRNPNCKGIAHFSQAIPTKKISRHEDCASDAVRLVTVRHTLEYGWLGQPQNSVTHNLQLALCEPCAAFHESKVAR